MDFEDRRDKHTYSTSSGSGWRPKYILPHTKSKVAMTSWAFALEELRHNSLDGIFAKIIVNLQLSGKNRVKIT